jgi:DNA processing protein
MVENKVYEVALGMLPGIGGYLSKNLVSYCGSAKKVFDTPKGKLLKIPGIGENLASVIISNKKAIEEAEKQVELTNRLGIKIFYYTDAEYPSRLKQIHDAPTLLYYKGTDCLNSRKIIGIVGTRQASQYGKEMVEKIVDGLKKHNPLILSGLAYGVDITAHKAALTCNLPTVGAMASGIDIIYPAAHKETAAKMTLNGGLITEYPLGSKPEPTRFPARNRIIAGLCDALIVVEAAEKGGALITAEMANEYSREVFAVPGNIGNKFSEGCNKLIQKHKAHIFTGNSFFEYIMNWTEDEISDASEKPKQTSTPIPDFSGLASDEKTVVNLLSEKEGVHIDELSWKTGIPASRLASILLNLEFSGIVKGLPGKKFKLC